MGRHPRWLSSVAPLTPVAIAVLISALLTTGGCLWLPPTSPDPGPATPTSLSQRIGAVFRSDPFHLEVALPGGWAASEGPEMLSRPFIGLVAFNSWGEPGFWALAVERKTVDGTSFTYSPQSTLSQLPEDGAYIILVWQSGGPLITPEMYGPEHELTTLDGLWPDQDCRAAGTYSANFYKWGRSLRLEVYCARLASEQTAGDVDALLSSWRFDPLPAGDVGWASVRTRKLLPEEVLPERFPIATDPGVRSSGSEDGIRTTEAALRGVVVQVTFRFRWDEPDPSSLPGEECPPERCHWWQFEVWPDGTIALTGEGGAELP